MVARILPSACVASLLYLALGAGGSAWAGKPRLAVLGLEVVPGPSGAVDPAMTQLARDLTRDLRLRAQSEPGPYVLAPNSSKELTEEKLLMSCDSEATTCMAVIGAGLATDFLLYGHLERKGDVYRVSLKLLDVKTRTSDVASEDMPVGGPSGTVARTLYARLTGEVQSPSIGTPAVGARGTMPPPAQSSSLVWKLSLGTSIAAAVSGGAYAWYAYEGQQRQVPHVNAELDNSDCGRDGQSLVEQFPTIDLHAFRRSCTWHTRIYMGYAVGAIGVVGAVVSLIMMSRDSGPSEQSPTGTRGRKPNVAIMPVVTPDGIGASLSARW